jgi:hypothetical protein
MGVKEYYLTAEVAGFDTSTLTAAAVALRSMGAKEYYYSTAAVERSTPTAGQEAASAPSAAQKRDHSSSALGTRLVSEGKRQPGSTELGPHSPAEIGVSIGSTSAPDDDESLFGDKLIDFYGVWVPKFMVNFLIGPNGPKRPGWILLATFLSTLTSVAVGLALGGVISIMILVVCLPTLIAFLAHWKFMTSNGSAYPVNWRIGFAVYFAAVFSLSMGFMLGSPIARALNDIGARTFSVQAAIMIFGVTVPFLFFVFLFWQIYFCESLGGRERRKKGCRSNNCCFQYCNSCSAAGFVAMFITLLFFLVGYSDFMVICARTHISFTHHELKS